MTEEIPLPLYGVWQPKKGWVRGADSKAFGDKNKEIAKQLAKRIGKGAVVYFIDPALVDLEQDLLEAEREQMGFFKNIQRVLKVK